MPAWQLFHPHQTAGCKDDVEGLPFARLRDALTIGGFWL
jgi:hypothetical protein